METLFDILKYTVPSLVVFATAYLLIRTFLDDEQRKRQLEIRLNNQKIITPLRLQAYERIILYLERINPQSLIMRVQVQGMTAKRLQSDMLTLIRAEFEHNLSQQIYMSAQAWEVAKNAKENIVKIVNTAADTVNTESPALDLSKIILESIMSIPQSPTGVAIDFIKKEINQFY